MTKSGQKTVKQKKKPRDIRGVVERITQNKFILILGSFLSVYALLQICFNAVDYLSPKLDITVHDVLRPSDPFSAPIILKNTGGVSINNIMLSLKINNYEATASNMPTINIENTTLNRASILIEKLKPRNSKTLDFHSVIDVRAACNTNPSVEIIIKYKKYFRSHSKTFKFKTERYESGKYVWLPD